MMFNAICGQHRPRSACTFMQADLGLHCPLTESVDTVVHVDKTENVQVRLHGCARSSGPSLFAYGIRAFFPHCTSC